MLSCWMVFGMFTISSWLIGMFTIPSWVIGAGTSTTFCMKVGMMSLRFLNGDELAETIIAMVLRGRKGEGVRELLVKLT